jgi:hypothetical protein
MVRRLAAGGKWIRTSGSANEGGRFETAFCGLCDGAYLQKGSAIPYTETDGSNPVLSTGEPYANLTSSNFDDLILRT